MDLKQHIRAVPDFPKPGILFYDISTLLAHPQAWQATVERLARYPAAAARPLVGIESRGFLVAAPLAYAIGIGFAMVRKKGKLPGKTAQHSYDLEYGTDTIEMQHDAIRRASGSSSSMIWSRPGDDAGDDRSGTATGRRGGSRRLHHRAGLPQRPGPSQRTAQLDGRLSQLRISSGSGYRLAMK